MRHLGRFEIKLPFGDTNRRYDKMGRVVRDAAVFLRKRQEWVEIYDHRLETVVIRLDHTNLDAFQREHAR